MLYATLTLQAQARKNAKAQANMREYISAQARGYKNAKMQKRKNEDKNYSTLPFLRWQGYCVDRKEGNTMATVVFSGGVGGARFLTGLCQVMDPREITVISNIGDDSVFYGLTVCPDIDIVIYTLADRINPKTGWGLEGDSFQLLTELERLGHDTWFHLGDKDLATHLHRTLRLQQGKTLTEVTAELVEKNGLQFTLLPASNETVSTRFITPQGEMAFQDYMVKNQFDVPIQKVLFAHHASAKPAPGVCEAIAAADKIIFAPSNPFISIGAILAVHGIKEALQNSKATITAISPIVNGQAIKGPAARLLADFGYEVSAKGVAEFYKGLVGRMVIDNQDAALAPEIAALGMECTVAQTVMTDLQAKADLAKVVLG